MAVLKRFIIIFFLIIGYGCAGMSFTFAPIPEQDSKEAKLYSQKCGACHSVPHPNRYTYSKWEEVVFSMEEIASSKLCNMQHSGKLELNDNEREVILNYLKTYCRN